MRKFWEIVKINYKSLVQYKWTFAMSVLAQPFVMVVNFLVFYAIYSYSEQGQIKGYDMEQMVWFYTANLLVNSFVWNNAVGEMSHKILSGDLSNDLLKPMSVFTYGLSNTVASRMIAVMMDFLPGMVVYSLILPPSFMTPASMFRFLVLMVPTFFLNYLLSFLVGLCAMVIKNDTSLQAVSGVLIAFAGGSLLPMEFYSGWLDMLMDFLPYKYVYYYPIQIFLNKCIGNIWEMWGRIICIQGIWLLALYALYKLVWGRAVKRYCAVG